MRRGNKHWVATVVGAGVLMLATVGAQARVTRDFMGGELEVEGFLSNESRARVGEHGNYLSQQLTRFQAEAALNFDSVGFFDELSFVTVLRPEFDAAHYYGRSLTEGHVGRGADKPSYLGAPFTGASDPIGFNGFGAGLSTGGLNKNVNQGIWGPSVLKEFETIAGRTNFPLLSPLSDSNLNCKNCRDVDDSHRNIALGKTGSSGALYPIRELYVDAVAGDWWFRVGKQQIVWGKTDFFRLQDIINPVDFGQHFFFDPFEDIRIPQWMASMQWKGGSIGPLNDTALQVVWNFDKFRSVGLGNPSAAWAHPFGKEKALFAAFNTYFSPEACVSAATATALGAPASTVCAAGDGRLPSGFGIPVGLGRENLPDHNFGNTEIGGRFEFRLGDFRLALSHYYGWTDTPVFRFDTVNVSGAAIPGLAPGLINDSLTVGLAEGISVPIAVMEPNAALAAAAAAGDAGALAAQAANNARLFYQTGNVIGGLTSIVYDQVNTTGLSADYFDDWSGIVFRLESSYTWDELVNNTRKANWVDKSDVIRYSIGMDRPTFIRMLNKNRTFFLSFQLFDTWYLDHKSGASDGMFVGEHNYITTFFFQTHYMRDRVIPSGFLVWEEESDSYVAGLNAEWLIDNHWSIKGGTHIIWGGTQDKTHDVGPFTSFTLDGKYAQEAVFGFAREGIGALRNNDEIFFQLKYQF